MRHIQVIHKARSAGNKHIFTRSFSCELLAIKTGLGQLLDPEGEAVILTSK